jgi:hypothetical protein
MGENVLVSTDGGETGREKERTKKESTKKESSRKKRRTKCQVMNRKLSSRKLLKPLPTLLSLGDFPGYLA